MKEKLNLFKELFSDYTNIAILHIDNSLGLVDSTLEEIKEKNQGQIKYIPFFRCKLRFIIKDFILLLSKDTNIITTPFVTLIKV